MATRKKPSKASKTTRKRSTRSRLTPRKDKRGLKAEEIVLASEAPEVVALAAEVKTAGGAKNDNACCSCVWWHVLLLHRFDLPC